MNNYVPGDHPALHAEPLRDQPHRRHPLLAFAVAAAVSYGFARSWRLSEAYERRTRGDHAVSRFRRSQCVKLAAAGLLYLACIGAAPFADPVTVNSAGYVSAFSFVAGVIMLAAAVIPVFFRARRELAWQRRTRR